MQDLEIFTNNDVDSSDDEDEGKVDELTMKAVFDNLHTVASTDLDLNTQYCKALEDVHHCLSALMNASAFFKHCMDSFWKPALENIHNGPFADDFKVGMKITYR